MQVFFGRAIGIGVGAALFSIFLLNQLGGAIYIGNAPDFPLGDPLPGELIAATGGVAAPAKHRASALLRVSKCSISQFCAKTGL
ncbi:hypothetical protein HMPREF3198_01105 [Winkia neuii]|nr:hypothetical protein HMPREF3198_01105 [Winkia neuii]